MQNKPFHQFFFRSYSRIAALLVIGMILLALDFVSKAYVYHVLPLNPSCSGEQCAGIPIFFDFMGVDFLISLAVNKGAAWGLLANFQIALIIVRIIVIFSIFIYLFLFNTKAAYDFPLVMILAGALGNVSDFFLYGFVIDFLQFNLWGYHFPIFNFADSCITIGVAWLFLISLLKRNISSNVRV